MNNRHERYEQEDRQVEDQHGEIIRTTTIMTATTTIMTTLVTMEVKAVTQEGEGEVGERPGRRQRQGSRLQHEGGGRRREAKDALVRQMMTTTRMTTQVGNQRVLALHTQTTELVIRLGPKPKRPRTSVATADDPGDAAPDCQCGTPAIQLTVRREGANKGRQFWTCSKGKDDGCGFFVSPRRWLSR